MSELIDEVVRPSEPEVRPPRVGVTGATGGVGGRVVGRLAADMRVAALARDPSRIVVDAAVEPRRADYGEPDSLDRSLRGLDQLVFVASDGDPAVMARHHANVVEAVASSDLRRVVYLSALGCGRGSGFLYAPVHRWTEAALHALPVSLAVARASVYTDFLTPWLDEALRTRSLAVPAGHGRVAPVTRDDVAAALAALSASGLNGTVTLSGPELLTMEGICDIAQAVSGGDVVLRPLPTAAYHEQLTRAGHPEWVADAYSSLFASIAAGQFSDWSDDVSRLTGKRPTAMATHLADHWSRSGR